MKNTIKLLLIAGFLVGMTGSAMAASGSTTFALSATVPSATSVSISQASINATTNVFGAYTTNTAMSFDPMTLNAANGFLAPNHYFAIDVGSAGGGGSLSVNVSYNEGSNPNSAVGGSTHGLGWKTVASLYKITPPVAPATTETQTLLTTFGKNGKLLLKTMTTAVAIPTTQLSGGFFRMYLGIVTNPTDTTMPTGAEVFSVADFPGSYTGSLVVSGTVA